MEQTLEERMDALERRFNTILLGLGVAIEEQPKDQIKVGLMFPRNKNEVMGIISAIYADLQATKQKMGNRIVPVTGFIPRAK